MTVARTDYLTVAEAAERLKVSRSTLWRWIDEGKLPAYRLGQRRVLIRPADLNALITPARGDNEARLGDRAELGQPLTDEERHRALAALEAARELKVRMRERHGEQLFPDSTEIVRAMREERTRELA
jgi:excisionase family DNA binding protein